MRVYHSTASTGHDPTTFFRRGTTIAHPESAERYHMLRKSIFDAGFDIHDAMITGASRSCAVHSADYVDFLSNGWNRRAESVRPGGRAC